VAYVKIFMLTHYISFVCQGGWVRCVHSLDGPVLVNFERSLTRSVM
jgi:hypothetical protein